MEYKTEIIEKGGRIKGAAESFEDFPLDNPEACYEYIQEQRKKPDFKYIKSYFPLPPNKIKQHLQRWGIFRSSFKTDQGMPGNFSIFYIDPEKENTVLEVVFKADEEGLAFPEDCVLPGTVNTHNKLDEELINSVQQAFISMDLNKTHELISGLKTKESKKGRQPFFFVRAAVLESPQIFGADIVRKVEAATDQLLNTALEKAEFIAKKSGTELKPNIIYIQPDVYLTNNGKTEIETIQTPDLGMFFQSLSNIPNSKMLPKAKDIMTHISEGFIESVSEKTKRFSQVYILTRDEVVAKIDGEDILEQGETFILANALKKKGKNVKIIGISQLPEIEMEKAAVIMMNVDYYNKESRNKILGTRSHSNSLAFFPDPYLQMEIQKVTGLKSVEINMQDRKNQQFLELIRIGRKKPINIQTESGKNLLNDKIGKIKEILFSAGIQSDIIRCRVENETFSFPVVSHHGWLGLTSLLERYKNIEKFSIDAIPLNKDNVLFRDTNGGARMNVYRFGAIVS